MPTSAISSSLWTRLLDALETPWERPAPSARQQLHDLYLWLGVAVLSLFLQLGFQSAGYFNGIPEQDIWKEHLAGFAVTVPIALRRRFPLSMLILGTLNFYLSVFYAHLVYNLLTYQVAYFIVLFSAVAWASDRRSLWVTYILVCLSTVLYLVITWTVQGSAYSLLGDKGQSQGPFSIAQGTFLAGLVINGIFYGGALVLGQTSWKAAYQQELLYRQREQILVQYDRLAQDAIIEDRLRIAQELHDSVGHQIAAISVQAGAARRFASSKPELLSQPLENIAHLAHISVTEMKAVLGLLRSADTADRVPALTDLSALVQMLEANGQVVQVNLFEEEPGALDQLTQGVSLSLYRIVQEAVNNVVKHSFAQQVFISVRADKRFYEIEVTDDGIGSRGISQSDQATLPTSFGLRGIRERAQALGGSAEIGERRTGGWRVRVRIPRSDS